MDYAVLNNEFIATQAGILLFITMMVKHGNIFSHQLNILLWVSAFRHAPV